MEKNSKKRPRPFDVATAIGRTAARLLADGRKGRRPSEPEFFGIDEKHERTLRMLYAFLRPEQRLPFEDLGLVTAETLRPVLTERMKQIRKSHELANSVRKRLVEVTSRKPAPNSWELGVAVQDLLPADRLVLGEVVAWLIHEFNAEAAAVAARRSRLAREIAGKPRRKDVTKSELLTFQKEFHRRQKTDRGWIKAAELHFHINRKTIHSRIR